MKWGVKISWIPNPDIINSFDYKRVMIIYTREFLSHCVAQLSLTITGINICWFCAIQTHNQKFFQLPRAFTVKRGGESDGAGESYTEVNVSYSSVSLWLRCVDDKKREVINNMFWGDRAKAAITLSSCFKRALNIHLLESFDWYSVCTCINHCMLDYCTSKSGALSFHCEILCTCH